MAVGNAYSSETRVWLVDTIGTLETGGCEVQSIEFIPAGVSHTLVLTDNANNPWLALKARSDLAEPVFRHFDPPIKLPSLKIATIGTSQAYIQFRTDIK